MHVLVVCLLEWMSRVAMGSLLELVLVTCNFAFIPAQLLFVFYGS